MYEIRWFFEGTIPEEVKQWLASVGEQRTLSFDEKPRKEVYFLCAQDISPKIGRGGLELKYRARQGEVISLKTGETGLLEDWEKKEWKYPTNEKPDALKDTDPGYKNIGGVPTNIRVEVQGTFSPRTDSNYQDIGIINVVRITRLATSNPTDGVAESWGSIFGTVLLGPNCPVIREPPDPECADKPYETSLVVTTADGARVIKEFNSDSNGKFNVDLPPGEYAIRSAAIANIRPHCSSNGTVRVKSNDSTEIVISCDTGIR